MLFRFTLIAAVLSTCSLRAPAVDPSPYKQDDNAALRYWTAFAVMPALNDNTRPKIDDWQKIALNDDVRTLLASHQNSFKWMLRATRLPRCEWGIETDEGPYALMPHLPRGRDLALAMLLKGRVDFADGKSGDAIDDMTAVLIMSRHLGRNGPVISVLVQDMIERRTIDLAAAELWRLSDAQAADFSKKLAALHPPATMTESIAWEKALAQWVRAQTAGKSPAEVERIIHALQAEGGTPASGGEPTKPLKIDSTEGVARELGQLDEFYDKAAKLTDLPQVEFEPAFTDLKNHTLDSGGALVRIMLPNLAKAKATETRTIVMRKMLEAALARKTGGEQSFNAVVDPTTNKPFELIAQKSGGFQLKSPMDDGDGKPVTRDFPAK